VRRTKAWIIVRGPIFKNANHDGDDKAKRSKRRTYEHYGSQWQTEERSHDDRKTHPTQDPDSGHPEYRDIGEEAGNHSDITVCFRTVEVVLAEQSPQFRLPEQLLQSHAESLTAPKVPIALPATRQQLAQRLAVLEFVQSQH